MSYYRLISSMLKAVISTLSTGLYAVYKGESSALASLTTNLYAIYKAESSGASLKTNIYRIYNGDNVNDSSVNAQNGTNIGGVTFTTGKIGNAFTFNGSNYVKLPNSSLNSLTGDFSVSLWFYGNGSGVVQALFSNTGYNGTIDKGFWIYQTTAYEIITAIYGGGGTTSLKTTSITNGVWHHIVVTRLGSTRTRIYINGALATSNSDTRNPEYFTNNTPCIGALDYNPNFALTTYYASNGTKIDGLNVWDRELSTGEVAELYNSGSGAEYPFAVGTINSTNDVYGINHGTAQGGLTYTTGKSGNAFTFNGTTAAVSLPTNMFNSFTGDFSISTWLYIPTIYLTSDTIYLLSNLYAPSWAVNFKGFALFTNGNNIYFRLADGSSVSGNTGFYTLSHAATLSSNTWYHIVATRKGSTGSKIYLNGSLVASDSNTVNAVMHTTMTPQIGRMYIQGVQNGYYAPNASKIDELNIWNKELSSTEITDLYNSGNGKFYQGNAFYSTVVNDSLTTYNGTAQGGLTYSGGKSGNAFTFNGTNAYVSLPNNTMKFTNNFTISLWFNVNTSDGTLFSNYHNDGSGDYGYFLYKSGSNLIWRVYTASGANDKTVAIPSYVTGTWFHVVVTANSTVVDGFSNGIYINGILAGYNTFIDNIRYHPTINHYPSIGAMYYGATPTISNTFNGKIDELNFWQRKLTLTEVTELYNVGAGKFHPY